MHLDVTPEGLVAAEAQVAALTARLVAQSAVQASAGSLVAPPGSDPVSIKTATVLLAGGVEHQVAAAMGNEELARSSMGVGESASSYAIGDGLAAAALIPTAV